MFALSPRRVNALFKGQPSQSRLGGTGERVDGFLIFCKPYITTDGGVPPRWWQRSQRAHSRRKDGNWDGCPATTMSPWRVVTESEGHHSPLFCDHNVTTWVSEGPRNLRKKLVNRKWAFPCWTQFFGPFGHLITISWPNGTKKRRRPKNEQAHVHQFRTNWCTYPCRLFRYSHGLALTSRYNERGALPKIRLCNCCSFSRNLVKHQRKRASANA